jgi:type I restriction enzyme S subunit
MENKLEDICTIQSGGTPPRSNHDYYNPPTIPWVKVGDINTQDKKLLLTEEFISQEGLRFIGNRYFKEGTLLIAIYGSSRGKSVISGMPVSCNQAVLGINSNDPSYLNNAYLKYWFDYNLEEHLYRSKGGAQKNLNADYIKNLKITPPSIEIQLKAVNYLDKLRDLIDKRKRTIQLLHTYSSNTFLEMFLENPKYAPSSKYWGLIHDVVKSSKYGIAKKANESTKGIPMLRMNNISYDGELDLRDIKHVELSPSEAKKYILKEGDILFNRTNSKELVGKTAVWSKTKEPYVFAGYLVKLTLNDKIMTPYYFSSYMNSAFGKKILFNKGKSSGNQVNFNPSLLKGQKILIPPIEIQKQYDTFYLKVNSQKKKLEKSLEVLEELHQTIIYQTFAKTKSEQTDDIDNLINDEIQLEIFLNTMKASSYESEEQYNIDVNRLHKILDRTQLRNNENEGYLKGLIQRMDGDKIVIETNKENKYRLGDEAATN